MSTKNTFEKMARNTWLLGLGSIENSLEVLSKSIENAQHRSNELYNEFITRGEEIQKAMFETTDELQSKGKKVLGINSGQSHEEKLAELNDKVEHLTVVVKKLMEESKTTVTKESIVPKEPKAVKPKAATRRVARSKKTTPQITTTSKTAAKTTKKATAKE